MTARLESAKEVYETARQTRRLAEAACIEARETRQRAVAACYQAREVRARATQQMERARKIIERVEVSGFLHCLGGKSPYSW
jgi:hypothetical protein